MSYLRHTRIIDSGRPDKSKLFAQGTNSVLYHSDESDWLTIYTLDSTKLEILETLEIVKEREEASEIVYTVKNFYREPKRYTATVWKAKIRKYKSAWKYNRAKVLKVCRLTEKLRSETGYKNFEFWLALADENNPITQEINNLCPLLPLVAANLLNYGPSDYGYDISPQNFVTDDNGELIPVDVFASKDILQFIWQGKNEYGVKI